MRRWIATMAVVSAVGALLVSPSPASAIPVRRTAPPVYQTQPVTVHGAVGCDVTSGQWQTRWWATVRGTGEIERVEDHVNGVPFEVVNSFPNVVEVRSTLPAGAREAGLTVTARWATDPTARTSVRTIALPDCVQHTTTYCQVGARPTYGHTFDAASGTGTVQVTNGIYCNNRYDLFSLASYESTLTGRYNRYGSGASGYLGYGQGSVGTIVLQTDLPSCTSQVVLRFGYAESYLQAGGPFTNAVLGYDSFSVGPYGHSLVLSGRRCVEIEILSLRSLSDGTMRFVLRNRSTAVLADGVTFWRDNHGWSTGMIPPGSVTTFDVARVLHQDGPLRAVVGLGVEIDTYRYGQNFTSWGIRVPQRSAGDRTLPPRRR